MLKLRVVLCTLKSSVQNLLRKILSRSETKERGMPWRQIISQIKMVTTVIVVKGRINLIKCAYLLERSTTTKMVSQPPIFGKPSIKSIKISSHTWFGWGEGVAVHWG